MYRAGIGDYVAGYGDPGIFGFLGNILKPVASVAASFIPGIGGVASKIISGIGAGVSANVAANQVAAARGGVNPITRQVSSFTPNALGRAIGMKAYGPAVATGTAGTGHITAPIAGSKAGTPHGGKLISRTHRVSVSHRRTKARYSVTSRYARAGRKRGRRRMTAKQRRYFGKGRKRLKRGR